MAPDTFMEMRNRVKQEIERSIDRLRRGELSEDGLRRVIEVVDEAQPKRQDLLYLQATSSSVESEVVGMSITQNGESSDGPPDTDDWPYKTVMDAIRDGWRVIKFPEAALMLDQSRNYGLGCEFILERYS